MRSFLKTCGAYALGAACAAGVVQAQDFRAPTMLSAPAARTYSGAPYVAANIRSVMAPSSEAPSMAPAELAPPIPGEPTAPALPSRSIHGGYGYYGDQVPGAPGVVYKGGAAGEVVYEGGLAPEAHGGMIDCGYGAGDCRRPACWFGGVRGLYMGLRDGDDMGFSYDDVAFEPQLLRTDEIDMDWSGGVEARIGRWFNCGRNGLELIYWGVYPDAEQAHLYANQMVGNLAHTFSFNSLSYDAGLGAGVEAVNDYFQPAQAHRLTRDWEFHNLEVNLLTLRNAYHGGCGVNGAGCGPSLGGVGLGHWDGCRPRLNLSWLAGFRFFRFDEDLQFASDNGDGVFDGGLDEMYYDIDVENNLYGFQLGGDAEFYLTRRISLLGGTKFGVYGNHMRQRQSVGGAAGNAFVNDPASPNFGAEYDINSSEDAVAFLGELTAGGAFYLTDNLRLTGGYRVVAASGVARATEQIPYNFDDILGANDPNNNGTMILHGAFGGVEFNY